MSNEKEEKVFYLKKTKEETILGYYGNNGCESFYVPFLQQGSEGKWNPNIQYYPITFGDIKNADNITIKTDKVYQNLGEILISPKKGWEYKQVNPVKNKYTKLDKYKIYSLLINYFKMNILVDFTNKSIEDNVLWSWWICERIKKNIQDWNVESWTKDNEHIFLFLYLGNEDEYINKIKNLKK